MAAHVKLNRHGSISLRIFWGGKTKWVGVGPNCPENQKRAERVAALVSREIEAGAFDDERFLFYFPGSAYADEIRKRDAPVESKVPTLAEYAPAWLEMRRTVSPPASYHVSEQHVSCYLLPTVIETREGKRIFGDIRLDEISSRHLVALRTKLLGRVKVSTAKNVMVGTLRQILNHARAVDEYGTVDPFGNLPRWPRVIVGRPDPLTAGEQALVLEYFASKSWLSHLHPFVATLFWTGMRPGEAVALRWGDVDLRARRISITKSRVRGHEGAPKTSRSNRTIDMVPELYELLRGRHEPWGDPGAYVFRKSNSTRPLDQNSVASVWRRCLHRLKIRHRKFYATRATFISIALTKGVNLKWLADYCGTSVGRIEVNYGRFLETGTHEQLSLLSETSSRSASPATARDR